MSARDDYEQLRLMALCGVKDARRALNEIDMLRYDVSKLLTLLNAAGVKWPTPDRVLMEASLHATPAPTKEDDE